MQEIGEGYEFLFGFYGAVDQSSIVRDGFGARDGFGVRQIVTPHTSREKHGNSGCGLRGVKNRCQTKNFNHQTKNFNH